MSFITISKNKHILYLKFLMTIQFLWILIPIFLLFPLLGLRPHSMEEVEGERMKESEIL